MGYIASIVVALIVGIVVGAVGGYLARELRDWLHKPRLTVSVVRNGPASARVLKVSNEKGWGPALDVQVFAQSLTREDDGSPVPEIDLPANLRWASETSHDRGLPVLARGLYHYCNVLHVSSPGEAGGRNRVMQCRLALKTKGETVIGPGKYVLRVSVAARNHKPVDALFRVTCTDKVFATYDEALRKGCTLEPLENC